jgi:PPP family 3-phenylpropionic acid transporter
MMIHNPVQRIIRTAASLDRRHWLFSGVELTFWFATACTGFLTMYLQSLGMSSSEVGVITAANSAAAVVAAPIWGAISDKIRSIRKVLMLCLVIGAITWASIPLASQVVVSGMMLSTAVIPMGCFFRNPAGSLKDSWVVQNANIHHLNYGAMRLWGSISYAVMSMSLSAVVPHIGVQWTFYLYGITIIPLLFLCVYIKDDGTAKKRLSFKEMHFGRIFRNYYFVTFTIFAILMSVPVSTASSFLPYLIENVGGDTSQIGIILGYKALLEVPMLFLMVRLRMRFSLPVLLGSVAFLQTLECFFYAVSPNMICLIASSTLYGLAGGINIGTATNYIYALAPNDLKATSQTVYGSIIALAGIVGNLVAGVIIDQLGVRSYYFIASGVVLFSLLFFALSFLVGKRILHKEIPVGASRLP